MENTGKRNLIIIVVVVIALVLVGVLPFRQPHRGQDNTNEPQACTMEAMICPDGSSVGRTGPNCQFAPCPGTLSTTTASGIIYNYPASFSTQYVSTVDWPPQVQVQNGPFVCVEAGNTIDRAGQTKKVVIGARTYCVTEEAEGAAGSTYHQYAYSTMFDTKVVTLTFTTRTPQCLNYPETQSNTCQAEQGGFDVNAIVDNIVQTMKFK